MEQFIPGQQGSRPRGRGRGRGGRHSADNSSSLQPKDSIPFETVVDSQLDHLVPLEERREHEILQEGVDVNDARESSHEEQLQSLLWFKQQVDQVCAQAKSQLQWEAGSISQLQGALHSRAKSETPSQEDYVKREGLIQRINALVASGLMQFTGMYVDTYGSYTSGFFTPQGDMDIAIEGHLQLRGGEYQGTSMADDRAGHDVSELDKLDKAALLKALTKKLVKNGLCKSRPQGIFHARVPIIKFEDRDTGIPCDMAVGSGGARFKSIVLKQLSLIDPRLPDLIRIVKQWAKAWNLNDASDGTFNTFALSMMVIFHLQTRSPPILPPICLLFGQLPTEVKKRPLHGGIRPSKELEEGKELRQSRALEWKLGRRQQNQESLIELFSSFFALYGHVLSVWIPNKDSRAIRCSAWAGEWTYKRWARNHIIPIEDPFDTTDNCARSIFAANAKPIQQAFQKTLASLQRITTPRQVEDVLGSVFSQKPKRESVNPFYSREGLAWRDGWNKRQEEREKRQEEREKRPSRQDRNKQPAKGEGTEAAASPRWSLDRPGRDERRLWQPPGRDPSQAQPFLYVPTHNQAQSLPVYPPGLPAIPPEQLHQHLLHLQAVQQQDHLRNLLTGAFQRVQLSQGTDSAGSVPQNSQRHQGAPVSGRQPVSTQAALLSASQELQQPGNPLPNTFAGQRR